MNAQLDNLSPVPPAVYREPIRMNRRTHIGRHPIDVGALTRFNSLLLRLDLGCRAFTRDQVASAARDLLDRIPGDGAAANIRQNMRRAGVIDLMLHDAGWVPTRAVLDPAQLVMHYIRDADGLIPDILPRVGRMDDAIVIDVAWPRLRDEVGDYLDFRRMRRVERGLGNGHTFDRAEWEHCRRVGESSYIDGNAGARFRVR